MYFSAMFFFYTYVGLLIVAGVWGIFFAKVDAALLLTLDLNRIPPTSSANLLSQYRFLRALEFGFGTVALCFRQEIFAVSTINRIFLGTMLLGVVGRCVSLLRDGRPRRLFYFFLIYEAAGFLVIGAYSNASLLPIRL